MEDEQLLGHVNGSRLKCGESRPLICRTAPSEVRGVLPSGALLMLAFAPPYGAQALFLQPYPRLGSRQRRRKDVHKFRPRAASTPPTPPEQDVPKLKKPVAKPRDSSAADAKPATSGDVASAYSLGETLRDSPLLNSTLMNAMRDYFGDDGREVQDYTKRPRNEAGDPMFRVILVGSGPQELALFRKLYDSTIVSGLYYCPDEGRVCDIEMNKFGASATVSAYASQEDVVRFAKWIVADAVFVGPEREECVSKESEKALADVGITLFPYDVSSAIVRGELEVQDCLGPLAGEEEGAPAEQLVE